MCGRMHTMWYFCSGGTELTGSKILILPFDIIFARKCLNSTANMTDILLDTNFVRVIQILSYCGYELPI